MKQPKAVILTAVTLVLGTGTIVYLLLSSPLFFRNHRYLTPTASEGTEENPFARKHEEWLLLRDPSTGKIPKYIATRELAFIDRLKGETRGKYRPVSHEWISRGPYNIGGRTKALAIDVRNENILLAGGVSSGMWKSTDAGRSWRKTTAPNQIHSVSCIVQNRATGKEHIWYYGTGEWASGTGGSASVTSGTNVSYRGDGVFKSTDNGETWFVLPSTVSETPSATDSFDFIWKLAAFGEDGVFAATSAGLFKSLDGGQSWEHELDFGENYPSTEIAITPNGTCYATIGGDGPANGIYKSVDFDTWENISPQDWPESTVRTVVAIVPSKKKAVYFLTEVAHWQQLLKKYEEGVGWTDLTGGLPYDAEMTTYGGNMLVLQVKPDDENTLFLGTVGLYRSVDGGLSFELIGAYGSFHVDQHAIVFYPSDPKAMIVGNDGGLFRTRDNTAETVLDPTTGENRIEWESLNNGYLTTQFYSVAVDHGTPGDETIIGGTQDNAWLFTKTTDPKAPWFSIFRGAADGGFAGISDGGEYYYTSQTATFSIWRHSFANGEHLWTEITPASAPGLGLWSTPVILDPHDTRIMYLASRTTLWRNSDLTQIPHIFPPEPTDANWSPFEQASDYYISALGMSAALPRRLYFASFLAHGIHTVQLFYIDNPHRGQPTPIDVTSENFPFYPYSPRIHSIAVDPRDSRKVLIVFPNYGVLSIYATEDGGERWIPVSGNLEENEDGTGDGPSVRWVSILYVDEQPVYFAGTSVGLFSTTALDGRNTVWIQEGALSIGNVVVDMIDVRQSDGYVVVGTHGNGVYSTYITEWPAKVDQTSSAPKTFHLLPPFPNPFNKKTAIRFVLQKPGPVKIRVCNVRGEEISRLLDGFQKAGEHQIRWTADGLSSGVYIIEMSFDGFSESHKVSLQK